MTARAEEAKTLAEILPEISSVLDVGCAEGRWANFFAQRNINYIGVDPDVDALKRAKNKQIQQTRFVLGRAESLPVNESFDLILFSYSWHFISDYAATIAEIKRVLATDGMILIIEPHEDTTGWKSETLRKGHADFNQEQYDSKIQRILTAREEISKHFLIEHLEHHSQADIYLCQLQRET